MLKILLCGTTNYCVTLACLDQGKRYLYFCMLGASLLKNSTYNDNNLLTHYLIPLFVQNIRRICIFLFAYHSTCGYYT